MINVFHKGVIKCFLKSELFLNLEEISKYHLEQNCIRGFFADVADFTVYNCHYANLNNVFMKVLIESASKRKNKINI